MSKTPLNLKLLLLLLCLGGIFGHNVAETRAEDAQLLGSPGIHFQTNKRKCTLFVSDVVAGSPAAKAGITNGDEIVSISGAKFTDQNIDQADSLLRGPLGTTLELGVSKAGALSTVKVTRELIKDDPKSAVATGEDSYSYEVTKKCRQFWKAPEERQSLSISVVFKIDGKGAVSDLHMAPSCNASPSEQFAAFNAVRRAAPFKPSPKDTEAVQVEVSLETSHTVKSSWLSEREADKRRTANLSRDKNGLNDFYIPVTPESKNKNSVPSSGSSIATSSGNNRTSTSGGNAATLSSRVSTSSSQRKENSEKALTGGTNRQANAFNESALAQLNATDYEKAGETIEKSIKLDPSCASYYYTKGLIERKRAKFKDAQADFEKALALDPSLQKCHVELARISAIDGNVQKALDSLWSLKSKSKDLDTERSIDGLLVELADERAVNTSMQVANASDRELMVSIINLDRKGKTRIAAELSTELERRNPTDSNAGYSATYLFKAGKYNDALAAYRRADSLNRSKPDYLAGIMSCCTQLGMLDDLQSARKDFVSRFPNDLRTKKLQEQIDYYEKDFSSTRSRETSSSQSTKDYAHFSRNAMPLKVYVPDFSQATESWRTPPDPSVDYPGTVQRACDDWTSISENKVGFQTTLNIDEANIVIEWVRDSSGMGHSFAAGTTSVVADSRGQPQASHSIVGTNKKVTHKFKGFL